MSTQDRNTLKNYFLNGLIPNEDHFADLIDSSLNQEEDGIQKATNQALELESGDTTEELIHFYQDFNDPNPSWRINQKPNTLNSGFTILDANSQPRIFIDQATDYVGIKTTTPQAELHVEGNQNVTGTLMAPNIVSPWIVPAGGIIMWSGDPTADFNGSGMGMGTLVGWALCDGRNNTPDLRGRFVVGYDPSDTDYDDTGKIDGDKEVALTIQQIPSHTHGVPSHSHGIASLRNERRVGTSGTGNFLGGGAGGATHYPWQNLSTDVSGGGATTSQGGGQVHENRPPYYVVAYIQKQP